jgi:hypothetical protein
MTGRTQTLRHTFLPLKSAHKSDEVFVGRDVLQGVGHRRPESIRLS